MVGEYRLEWVASARRTGEAVQMSSVSVSQAGASEGTWQKKKKRQVT